MTAVAVSFVPEIYDKYAHNKWIYSYAGSKTSFNLKGLREFVLFNSSSKSPDDLKNGG